jgi:DNA polymerase-1
MDKLILIDGNSLLNRAYYAMSVFSTKDGLPTNGIFGFVKLIFKIIEDERPTHFIVAFDVHAPTFRHKLYDGYKATRKPMPEELAKQFPVLKELLTAMNIKIAELAGYEADDVIGTLSRSYENTEVLIYTGDRDSYQLVNDHVTVCFTKRGVSDLDRITAENFKEKIGLDPWQIVEEKALMGDKSDNIPGVYGIGGKSALELLQKYGTVENVYAHLEELSPKIKTKLEEGRESALLSHTLAKIDTNVPIRISSEESKLICPFSQNARDYFSKLEFRSLLDSPFFEFQKRTGAEIVRPSQTDAFLQTINDIDVFSFCINEKEYHVCANGKEYIFTLKENIFDLGVYEHDLISVLQPLLSAGKRMIVADARTTVPKLKKLGLSVNCTVEDTALLRYSVNSNNRPMNEKEYVRDYSLTDENMAYAVLLAFQESWNEGTEEDRKLYHDVELPLSAVLLDMEQIGIRVDTDKFPEFSAKYHAEMDSLSQQIFELAGVASFNLNSPFKLSEILFEKLGYETKGLKKNIRGGYSTSAEVLEKLAEKHEIARLVLRYRELQKLQSTYVDGIRPLVVDELVHTTFQQTATTTGRLSSVNPNLQNIPVRKNEGKELRKLFIAREGNVLVDADYSQIELRLLAHFSECKALLQAYRNGEDVHAATAARVAGVTIKEVTPQMRSRAKTINFGIIYGMSKFGLAKDMNCTQTEAQEYIDKYFELHPEVKEYMEANVRFAKEHGFVTTILGRKRYIPEIKSSNFNTRSFGERAAMNMPLQGSAADVIKLAMLRVAKRLQSDAFRAKLVLQVHDELILDAPKDEAERAAVMLKEEMERAIRLKVPLIAEVSIGRSWYDAK